MSEFFLHRTSTALSVVIILDMTKLIGILLFSWGLVNGSTVSAQSASSSVAVTEGEGKPAYWQFVGQGGAVTIPLARITSVSLHEYVMDQAIRVFECTVDTMGSQTIRFYQIEPLVSGAATSGVQEAVREGVSAAASALKSVNLSGGNIDPDRQVVKHYPTTTHAKTTEFRFKDRESVSRIYDHIVRAMTEPQQSVSHLISVDKG